MFLVMTDSYLSAFLAVHVDYVGQKGDLCQHVPANEPD
jgi:hypothetical protein